MEVSTCNGRKRERELEGGGAGEGEREGSRRGQAVLSRQDSRHSHALRCVSACVYVCVCVCVFTSWLIPGRWTAKHSVSGERLMGLVYRHEQTRFDDGNLEALEEATGCEHRGATNKTAHASAMHCNVRDKL